MNSASYLRDSIAWAHELLRLTVADLTQEQADWLPPGIANPIGATYAHAILGEDGVLNGLLRGTTPLYKTTWEGRTGVSDPQPSATQEWARTVRIDLPALATYADAVLAESDAYFATLSDTDIDTVIDLTRVGFGSRTLGWGIHALVIGHLHNMTGEISCLKGIQGAQGYPF